MATAPPLTYTLDLENHRAGGAGPHRYQDNARRILDFLLARGVHATIFVVGSIVPDCAGLLRDAHAAGHELALHSYAHTPLVDEDAASFSRRLGDARKRLQDISGAAVVGFRAPVFSLTPASRWVADALVALGFEYSSSVVPGVHPLYGYPQAPATPFRWPGGLVELPVPVVSVGPLTLPFLGGIYLRYLPAALVARWRLRLAPDILPWSYIHPYDVDTGESYFRFPGTSALMSWLLWRNRHFTLDKIDRLLVASAGIAAPPLARLVASGRFAELPRFEPAATAVNEARQ